MCLPSLGPDKQRGAVNDVRKDRQVKNEVLFRKLNERIDAVAGDLTFSGVIDDPDVASYLCECADDGCLVELRLSREEYEHVRERPIQFVVSPGHVVADIETVIEANERFAIVEKDPGERTVARATDPRS
jgi:hypothetical protein